MLAKRILLFFEQKVYFPFVAPILFFILEILAPKKKGKLVVGIPKNRFYIDNARYFFEYCISNTDLDIYLLTKKYTLFQQLDAQYPGRILYAFSIKGLLSYLSASIVFMTNNKWDFHPYFPIAIRKTFVNLWHGSPLKRVDGTRFKKSGKARNLSYFCKYSVASSEFTKYLLATVWKVHIDQIWLTGQPRNDVFFRKNSELGNQYPYLNKKIILYAPTFREKSPVRFFPFPDYEPNELIRFLEKNDSYLLMRCHVNDWKLLNEKLNKEYGQNARIMFAGNEQFPCIQELLAFTDILITDYSSVYFDFLLLDKPVIFLPYDYAEYEKERGFNVNYFENTPGPKIGTQAEFIQALKTYFEFPEKDAEWRKKIRDKYNKFIDGKSSERIVQQVRELINKDDVKYS